MYRKKQENRYPFPRTSPVQMPPQQDPIQGPYLSGNFDPEGSYTGNPERAGEQPVQDADDLS